MIFKNHFFKSITSTCKSVIAIATAFLAGCTPKVEYPTDNEMAKNDQNSQSKAPEQSMNAEDKTSAKFIPNTPDQTSSVYIETYSIRAKIIGSVAQIETEFTLRNPDLTSVGGELDIPLPEGAVVTGYAMDIRDEILGLKAANTRKPPTLTDGGHTMVDAVMIGYNYGCRGGYTPPEPPTPSSNHFLTSIDTILPHGYRMVRLVYTMPLKLHSDGTTSVLLPMQKQTLRKRTIQISVNNQGTEPPVLNENIGSHFQKDGSAWVLEQTNNNVFSEKDLTLSFPAVSGEVFQANNYIERDPRHPNELFVMFDIHVGQNQASPQDLSHLRLIWDASGSRTREDIQQALEVVRRLPENSLYELHVFHYKTEPARTFQNRSELIQYLETLHYDGGTNYMSLEGIAKSDFDGATLIFTDGVDAYHKSIPSFGIHSLALLSGKVIHENDLWTASYGHTIRMNELTLDEVLAEIQKPHLSVFDVTGSHVSHTQWIHRGTKDRLTAIVKWDGTSDTVTLQLTDGTTIPVELQDTDTIHEGRVLSTTWAIHEIRTLSERINENQESISFISKKYTVPSAFTKLAILTNLEQYKNFNIEPPNSLTDIHQAWIDYRNRLNHARSVSKHEKSQDEPAELEDELLEAWDKYVDWWKHPLPKKLEKAYACNDDQTECWTMVSSELGWHYTKSFQPPKDWNCKSMKNCIQGGTELAPISYGCSGSGMGNFIYGPAICQAEDLPIFITSFESSPDLDESDEFTSWDPNTPYLTSLEDLQKAGANAESLYTEYLRWQSKYARSSAFYFDVANYFFSENLPSYGIRILSNLFEHSFNNNPEQASCLNDTDAYAIARAYVQRLINAGELNEALSVIETFYSPDDPEPHSCRIIDPRTSPEWLFQLATLLDMRARKTNNPDDAQRAIAYYHKLSLSSYEDISFPSIVHFNSLRSWITQNHFKLNIPSIPNIDQQLNKPLDVDLRIVVESEEEYNRNRDDRKTTLIHVTEPTSESLPHYDCTAYADILSRSAIGGMIGNNTYVIKKAEKGEYILSIDITGMENKDLLGQEFTTITLYRNWGRPNQTQEIIVKRRRLATLDEKDNEKETVVVKIE